MSPSPTPPYPLQNDHILFLLKTFKARSGGCKYRPTQKIQQPKESESSVFKVEPPPAFSQKPDFSPLRFFSAWHLTSLVTSFSAWCSSAHSLSPARLYSGCVRGEGQPPSPCQPFVSPTSAVGVCLGPSVPACSLCPICQVGRAEQMPGNRVY